VKYLEKLLDFRDSGGTSDQDDFVDVGLVELGVPQGSHDGVHGSAEQVGVQLLEAGAGDGGVEIDALGRTL
jgi:hypothetical protein